MRCGKGSREPYKTEARFNSICPGCGKQIKKGDTIYYWPKERKAYCECAENDYRRFLEDKFDEKFMVNRSL